MELEVATASPAHHGFRYRDVRVGAASPDPSHLAWLDEFLVPPFERVEPAACEDRVSLRIDATLFDALHRAGPTGEELTAFVLDSQALRLPRWRSDEPGPVVFDERFELFYRTLQGGIELVARRNDRKLRTPLMRVVRELAMTASRGNGSIFLHAACFSVEGRGVIVTGPKATGKTTLLLHALRDQSAVYVSNDRLLVRFEQDRVVAQGMPAIVTIRPRTLTLFPELLPRIMERRYEFRSTLAEAGSGEGPEPRAWHGGRYGVAPAQLCALVDCEVRATVPVRALWFPRFGSWRGGPRLRPLDPADAAERLSHSVFGARELRERSELFVPSCGVDPLEVDAVPGVLRRLTAAVPCFECELGVEAYRPGSLAPALAAC